MFKETESAVEKETKRLINELNYTQKNMMVIGIGFCECYFIYRNVLNNVPINDIDYFILRKIKKALENENLIGFLGDGDPTFEENWNKLIEKMEWTNRG